MESWNANLRESLQRGDKPVVKAEFVGLSTAFLEVRDWTAGAGDSFSVVRNGSVVLTLTEGLTPFIAEVSNEQTAINIVKAILTFPGFKVQRIGSKIKIRGFGDGTDSLLITTTDANAWRQYRIGLPYRVAFCSDAKACGGRYGAELKGMTSKGSAFDLVERTSELAAFDLVCSAEVGSIARGLVTSVPAVGQVVELYVGTVDLAESDYELFATSVVMDYQLGDSEVTFNLAEPTVTAADAEVSAHFVAMHPFDILKWCWARTFLDSALWDVASLDSTADPDISHWLVSAHGYHFWSGPPVDKRPPGGFADVKIKDIMAEVEKILPGMVRRNAAAVLEYLPFDPNAARLRHFERKDWESVNYETLSENQYYSVAAFAPESELFGGGKQSLLKLSDNQAAGLTGALEADDGRPTTLKIESRFFGTPAFIRTELASPATTLLEVHHGAISGISGCRPIDIAFDDPTILSSYVTPEYQRLSFSGAFVPVATQRANDDADSGAATPRTAHYLITDGSNHEIVEATATAYPGSGNRNWYRPAAFIPSSEGGSTTVNGDQTADTTILVADSSIFTTTFPYVKFELGGGAIDIKRILSNNRASNTLTLSSAVTVSNGDIASPAAPANFIGSYELAFAIYNQPTDAVYFPGHAEATVTRGVLRTTAQAWANGAGASFGDYIPRPDLTPMIYDLTIAKRVCEMQLERFRYGVPICSIVLKLEHGDIQEGDFVSFDDERFLWQEHDGADQTVVWEVIGKRVQPIGDSPRVELRLAWVRSDAIPYVTLPDPVWEIPLVTPVSPIPTITLVEPYYDDAGIPYLDTLGALYYPI